MKKIPQILTPKTTYTTDYPMAVEYANTQMDVFWHPDEIEVEKDLHDLKTNFTEAEYHGVITTLKLFTLYELVIGKEYWSGRVSRLFPRPDIERMANAFSFFEINVHAPFYNKLNQVLGLDTDEFYESYIEDETLKNRMEWINRAVSKPTKTNFDILESLGTFSIIEGAILYSNFAFLKHFQAEGKNKLVNVTAGINFSVRDENCLIKGTEVLTTSGWKPIEIITLDDTVLQYDNKNQELSFSKPYNLTKTTSTESYLFESDNFHQHVTPNHRMILKNDESLAIDTPEGSSFVISGNKITGDDILTDEDKLTLSLIVSNDFDINWLYNKMEFTSSTWAKAAVLFYINL